MKTRQIFFFLLVVLISCNIDTESDLYGNYRNVENISELIRFVSIQPDTIAADSSSSSQIFIQITPQTDSIYREVLLITENGLFANNNDSINVSMNYDGSGSTTLFSSKRVGISKLTAKVKDVQIDTSIYFNNSYPEDFLLKASTYNVDSGQSVNLKVDLYRKKGHVSNNQKIHFSVIKNDSVDVYPLIPDYGIIRNDSSAVEIDNPFGAEGIHTFKAIVPVSLVDSMERTIRINFLN